MADLPTRLANSLARKKILRKTLLTLESDQAQYRIQEKEAMRKSTDFRQGRIQHRKVAYVSHKLRDRRRKFHRTHSGAGLQSFTRVGAMAGGRGGGYGAFESGATTGVRGGRGARIRQSAAQWTRGNWKEARATMGDLRRGSMWTTSGRIGQGRFGRLQLGGVKYEPRKAHGQLQRLGGLQGIKSGTGGGRFRARAGGAQGGFGGRGGGGAASGGIR